MNSLSPIQQQMAAWFAERQTKDRALAVADLILADPAHIWEAWRLYAGAVSPLRERMCWAIWLAIEQRPGIVSEELVVEVARLLPTMAHDAEKRTFMRLMADFPIPEDWEGPIYDLAFEWLNNPLAAIANRVNAMEALYKIGLSHPDLHAELALALRAHLPYASPAFKSRAQRILARIDAGSRR